MNIRKITAAAAAFAMLGTAAACSSKDKKSITKNAPEAASEAVSESVEGVDAKDAVDAVSGDAYLAIADEGFNVQYLGDKDENKNNQLSYDAGIAHIKGNGDYTVSVTADTNGFRYDTTGDINGEFTVKGLGFAAVIIDDAEKTMPDAVITVKGIKVDGKDVALTKKCYTNTESGSVRANIFNEWVSDDSLPSDAKCAEGALFNNGDTNSPSDINDGGFSAQIVSRDDFAQWKNVEVSFTVSGMEK
ncbi:hypothetical protein [Ruminococcus sp.]|uniref:hypothetical protein n=1 Tax=Ruminococcus sp. TaxID=41978 RepID=UPI0025CCB3B9|nr:hypothetical protein [Ruminococcus sp.]MCR4639893.1 hypothetical protein [Ruminococcus sp.]